MTLDDREFLSFKRFSTRTLFVIIIIFFFRSLVEHEENWKHLWPNYVPHSPSGNRRNKQHSHLSDAFSFLFYVFRQHLWAQLTETSENRFESTVNNNSWDLWDWMKSVLHKKVLEKLLKHVMLKKKYKTHQCLSCFKQTTSAPWLLKPASNFVLTIKCVGQSWSFF